MTLDAVTAAAQAFHDAGVAEQQAADAAVLANLQVTLDAANQALSQETGEVAELQAQVAALEAQIASLLDLHDLPAWTKSGPALNITGDLIGQGNSRTIYSMPADTSTMAGAVAAIPSGSANPYWLMWLGGSDANHVVDSPTYKDFWLRGTDQGHQYQSAQVRYTKNALLSGLVFTGFSGSGTTPPGETHGAPYFFHSDGGHTEGCVFDGRVDGKGTTGIAATLLGHWDCNGVTHDNVKLLYGANGFGAAHSGGTYGQITYNAPEIGWCAKGFNFEKLDANAQGTTIEIVDPNVHDLSVDYIAQISTANLKASAVVNIRYLTVPLPASTPVRLYGKSANGGTNGQTSDTVHVFGPGNKDVTATQLHVVSG